MADKLLKSIKFPTLPDRYVIGDSTLTEEGAAAEAKAVGEALATKADTRGRYGDLIVGGAEQLMADGYETDKEPYLFRPTGGSADVGNREYLDKIVGGTVAWNQNIEALNFDDGTSTFHTWDTTTSTVAYNSTTDALDVTIKVIDYGPPGGGHGGLLVVPYYSTSTDSKHIVLASHVYYYTFSVKAPKQCACALVVPSNTNANQMVVPANVYTELNGMMKLSSNYGWTYGIGFNTVGADDSGIAVNDIFSVKNVMIFDLTAMFGSTIADYIYSLEQSSAGAGVAWFRNYFPKDYYPYDAGTLKSVQTSAHKTYDADGNVIGTYPLDSSLTLRGVPRLVDGKLAYDGDVYPPSGEVQRRYGVVDLGTLTWTFVNGNYATFATTGISALIKSDINNTITLCAKYKSVSQNNASSSDDNYIWVNASGLVSLKDTSKSSLTVDQFKTAMSGVYLVYELATPTTETAEGYEQYQICDPSGTEEFVTTGIVPVGHETRYPHDLKKKIETAPDSPSTDGTYLMKRSGGKNTYMALPSTPSANGAYVLTVTVSGGNATYSWTAKE